MPKDRINDLRKATSRSDVSYEKLPQQIDNHEDQCEVFITRQESVTIPVNDQSPVTDFLRETNLLRSIIDNIHELSQKVKHIHTDMLVSPANPKLSEELDHKTEEIKKLAYDTSTRLKKMEEASETRDDPDKTNAQRRIEESQIFVLTRRFRDTMNCYNQEAVSHRERCKKAIVRELEIAGHRKSDDELEEILGDGFSGTLNFCLLVDTQKAKQALGDLEARRQNILKLENCLKELHSMFRDLAALVADQGQMIDCIEYNVAKAVDYVHDAAEDVHIADTYRKKAVNKKVVISILLILGICLIIIIIFSAYLTQKKIIGR